MTWNMTLADMLPHEPTRMWALARQVGVTAAVTGIPDLPDGTPPWDYAQLVALKERFSEAGLDLQVIESAPHSIMNPIRLGLPDRDERIDQFCRLLEAMGRAGIPVICPNWMPLGPLRTDNVVPARGGSLVTAYDHDLMNSEPLTAHGEVTEAELWENAAIFLEQAVPVAEESGVRIAVHPDDPPVSPIRGIGRILTSPDAMQRWAELVPSPYNGVTFCQGTVSTMNVDVPAAIRQLGSLGLIHFVHFRDIEGTPERFTETWHELGRTDMVEAIRAYRDIGFTGPMRVDHVPTLEGEDNSNPGYETLGRLYAIGYTKGLIEAVDRMSEATESSQTAGAA
jgi:mannonate dehydratase